MNTFSKSKIVTTPNSVYEVRDGILFVKILDPQKQTLEEVRTNIAAIKEVSQGKVLPLITDVTMKGLTKEAKDYIYKEARNGLVSAAGLVTTNNISYFFGQMFFHMVKSFVPIRLFRTEAKAEEWIHSLNLPERYR